MLKKMPDNAKCPRIILHISGTISGRVVLPETLISRNIFLSEVIGGSQKILIALKGFLSKLSRQGLCLNFANHKSLTLLSNTFQSLRDAENTVSLAHLKYAFKYTLILREHLRENGRKFAELPLACQAGALCVILFWSRTRARKGSRV